MRLFKRRVGQALVGQADANMKMTDGDRVRIGAERPTEARVFRDEVLRELSKAAREALNQVRLPDNQ